MRLNSVWPSITCQFLLGNIHFPPPLVILGYIMDMYKLIFLFVPTPPPSYMNKNLFKKLIKIIPRWREMIISPSLKSRQI